MAIQELVQIISSMDLDTIATSVKSLDIETIKSASDVFLSSTEKISVEGWSSWS